MDSLASFSFWVVGVVVMLAGQVLGSAVGKGQELAPGLFVCLYGLSVIRLVY